ERLRAWEELADLDVPIHSVSEGQQSAKMVYTIMAAVAEQESDAIGERVSDTWRHATSLGWAKTTRAPWGYCWRPATAAERQQGSPKSVLDLDPDAAPFAAEAFQRIASGESLRSVARWASALDEPARGQRELTRRTLQDRLASPVYCGRP